MKQSFLYALFSAFIAAAFFTGAPAFGQAPPAGETNVSYVRTADHDLDSTERNIVKHVIVETRREFNVR